MTSAAAIEVHARAHAFVGFFGFFEIRLSGIEVFEFVRRQPGNRLPGGRRAAAYARIARDDRLRRHSDFEREETQSGCRQNYRCGWWKLASHDHTPPFAARVLLFFDRPLSPDTQCLRGWQAGGHVARIPVFMRARRRSGLDVNLDRLGWGRVREKQLHGRFASTRARPARVPKSILKWRRPTR
jgi:hypothetical protein